jgi:pectate lyase
VIAGGSTGTGAAANVGGSGGTAGMGGAVAAGGTGGGAAGGGSGGSPAGALFADDFETPAFTMSEWFPNTAAGDWSIVTDGSNVYRQGVLTNEFRVASAGDVAWTDLAIEARVKVLQFGGQSTSYLVGIYARFRGLDDHYYVALREDGRVAIRAKLQGSNTTLGSAVDAGIVPNTWYTVKLEVIGTTINAYLDGALVVSASDAGIAAGAVGLGTSNSTAQFDDVRVTAP